MLQFYLRSHYNCKRTKSGKSYIALGIVDYFHRAHETDSRPSFPVKPRNLRTSHRPSSGEYNLTFVHQAARELFSFVFQSTSFSYYFYFSRRRLHYNFAATYETFPREKRCDRYLLLNFPSKFSVRSENFFRR